MWKLLSLTAALLTLAVDAPEARDPDRLSDIRRDEMGGTNSRSSIASVVPSPPETTYFGGTAWAADSMRWEALPDSCWTFESGVGSHFDHSAPFVDPFKDESLHAVMEGWIGWDSTSRASSLFFRRLSESDFSGCESVCVGDATGILEGDWSFHAGVLCMEADSLCYAAGQGYGPGWDMAIRKNFLYEGGDLSLRFRYVNETEDSFDFTHVILDSTGSGDTLTVASFTGTTSGTTTVSLLQGVHLPVNTGGTLTISFRVVTDDLYDDQDGYNPTACGAFSVDDVLLTVSASGDTLFGPDTFETGVDGWMPDTSPIAGPGGDWSDIVHLSDLDPLLAPSPIQDSVLVFVDPFVSPLGHNLYQDNLAVSPWIDLKAANLVGFPEKFLVLDEYTDLPFTNYVFARVEVQWYPQVCPVTGKLRTSRFEGWGSYNRSELPGGGRYSFDLSGIIDAEAEQVRVGVGVVNLCRFFQDCTGTNNASPYFDNIQFGVLQPSTVTIQDAVDAAADGDTITVPPGVYFGEGNRDIDLRGKRIVLWAPAGPESTIIDCEGLGRGFIFQSGEDTTTIVDGFTIRNGHGPTVGGGIAIVSPEGGTVRNCIIRDCTSGQDGGGAYAEPLHLYAVFEECVFENNTAEGFGGGVYVSAAKMRDCLLSGNEAMNGSGGGLYSGAYGVWISRCEVVANTAALDGGGMAGIYLLVNDCTIDGNTAGGYGGGIARITQAVLSAESEKPEEKMNEDVSHLFNCRVRNNQAQLGGGGIASLGVFVTDCLVSGNVSAGDGGGVWLQGDYILGLTRLRGSLVTGNEAARGGGVYAMPGDPRNIGPQELSGCTVSGNRAQQGGGLYLDAPPLGAMFPASLDTSIVWGNCADGDGQEIYVNGPGTVLDVSCSAVDQSGIGGIGRVRFDGPQVFADPLFCDPFSCTSTPTTQGDYMLQPESPCLPGNSPCDILIGALGEICSTVGIPSEDQLEPGRILGTSPNPFGRSLFLSYAIPAGETGTIRIFDTQGRLVWTQGELRGNGKITWQGTGGTGRVAAGLYFVQLRAGKRNETHRVIFVPR